MRGAEVSGLGQGGPDYQENVWVMVVSGRGEVLVENDQPLYEPCTLTVQLC